MRDRIHQWVQRERATILDCLRYIVRIDTQNLAPQGNELQGQLALAGLLRALDCEVDIYPIDSVPGLLQHPQYWPERPCTGRPNVMALRRGQGAGRSLIFSGHMDTVPVGPDPWQHAPWAGTIEDGKLWGLGAYDMKGGLVAAAMVMKALNDLDIRLAGDLMVESVVDEEFGGCNGTLAARLKYNADLAIVPEPTNLIVCPAHHGGLMLRVIFEGKPGWGFSPEHPVDPVIALAHFVCLLNDWSHIRPQSVTVPNLFRSNPGLPVLVNQLKAGDVALPFFADRVPGTAWLTLWAETYPGMTQLGVLADLQAYYRQAQASDSILAVFEPQWKPIRWLSGSAVAADHDGVNLLANALRSVRGQEATVQGAPFACDGHIFNLFSPTPMILFGPTGGQPHSPDEFINVEDYLELVEVFVNAAIEWCGIA